MRLLSLALPLLAVSASITAQRVTDADYARAESMLQAATNPLVDNSIGSITWTGNDQAVFTLSGKKAELFGVDATTGKIAPATPPPHRAGRGNSMALSPDGKTELFIKDWNLYARDTKTKAERQLTTDGTKDYGYATDNAGWKHTANPIVLWSPDGKKIATFQQDQRKTGEMYLVSTEVGHPHLEAWKYPLPGDKDVTMIERVILDAETGKVTRLRMAPDQHRSTLCDDVSCAGGWEDVQWSPDSSRLAFVSTSRDHKQENLRIADAATGEVRNILEEKVKTYFESGQGKVNWKYLFKTDEVLWYSERDNWGQLYLYDGKTGKLKNKVTTGEGTVNQVLRVDEDARSLVYLATGKESGRDPYYVHAYSVSFDGSQQKLLTPENASHAITLSPDGKHFIDTFSTITTPPITNLRNADGTLVAEINRARIDRLLQAGWVPPIPFTTKCRDNITDCYGVMFKPSHFDASRKYPIITQIYPGPQTGSVHQRSFMAARGDNQALAELGFIVIALDGMGTPLRSKSFHDAWFANAGDNTLPDQIAAVKQLAAKYPYIDITRAGIWGHSGGGNATADALFRYPDFYKVGIAESGNHDNRTYEDDWDEKYVGLLEGHNYDDQANQSIAKNLKGHLLLVHGTMDDNVPPNNTLLVVDALIKANKDFDLLLIPNAHHGYGDAVSYAMRRRWDYFVRYLLNQEPPKEFQMKPQGPPARP